MRARTITVHRCWYPCRVSEKFANLLGTSSHPSSTPPYQAANERIDCRCLWVSHQRRLILFERRPGGVERARFRPQTRQISTLSNISADAFTGRVEPTRRRVTPAGNGLYTCMGLMREYRCTWHAMVLFWAWQRQGKRLLQDVLSRIAAVNGPKTLVLSFPGTFPRYRAGSLVSCLSYATRAAGKAATQSGRELVGNQQCQKFPRFHCPSKLTFGFTRLLRYNRLSLDNGFDNNDKLRCSVHHRDATHELRLQEVGHSKVRIMFGWRDALLFFK